MWCGRWCRARQCCPRRGSGGGRRSIHRASREHGGGQSFQGLRVGEDLDDAGVALDLEVDPFQRIDHRPSGATEAHARGVNKAAMVKAFEEARAGALKVCRKPSISVHSNG